MNYGTIKKAGILIGEKDYYRGGAFLYTKYFWVYGDSLYIRTEHSNMNEYTGKTDTICFMGNLSIELEKYSDTLLSDLGMDEDGIQYLHTLVKSKEIPTNVAISEARVKAGLTITEVCELLEIPQRTFLSWESGERTPPKWAEKLLIEKLKKIAEKS